VVVDEAGMLGTRDAAQLLWHVDAVEGKLVLVGDPRQLQSIAAGGLLGGLAVRLGAIELTENRRQRQMWERSALESLRSGGVESALAQYRAHGRVSFAHDREDALCRLVADWHQTGDVDGTVMLAHYRRDVAELNARGRAVTRAEGRLGTDELVVGAPDSPRVIGSSCGSTTGASACATATAVSSPTSTAPAGA
jgi:ATP-dependent exoDNAse (exonuclease V) alpha subunit